MKNKKTRNLLIVLLALVLVFAGILVVQAITENNEAADTKSMTSDSTDKEMTDEKVMTDSFQGDAYNFMMMDTDGNTHTLEQYAGKKVYLKFWATWCPSCLEGLEELDELHEQTKDRDDIVILTVVAPGYSGEKSKEKFIEWYEGHELEFTVLLDEGGAAFFEYGIRAVPSSYFIDGKGNLADSRLGHVYNEDVFEILDSVQ